MGLLKVKVVSEFTPETNINYNGDSLKISPESWSARIEGLFEDPEAFS